MPFLTVSFFGWEGSPAKIDQNEKETVPLFQALYWTSQRLTQRLLVSVPFGLVMRRPTGHAKTTGPPHGVGLFLRAPLVGLFSRETKRKIHNWSGSFLQEKNRWQTGSCFPRHRPTGCKKEPFGVPWLTLNVGPSLHGPSPEKWSQSAGPYLVNILSGRVAANASGAPELRFLQGGFRPADQAAPGWHRRETNRIGRGGGQLDESGRMKVKSTRKKIPQVEIDWSAQPAFAAGSPNFARFCLFCTILGLHPFAP